MEETRVSTFPSSLGKTLKQLITLTVLAFAIVGSAAAQSSSSTNAKHTAPSRDKGMAPISSPEPVTMIALAGGSAAAVGLAARRRKKK